MLTTAREWSGAWTDASGVTKTAETAAAGPLTGRSVLPDRGVPTVNPWSRNVALTWATSAGLGPKAAANWAGVIERR